MQRVFADTAFYYAVIDHRDPHHAAALVRNQRAIEEQWRLISTWEVIVETITLLRYRYSHRAARLFIDDVLPEIDVVYIDDDIRRKALATFVRLASDKRLSLCDVISYLVITQRLGHIPALTFDEDFSQLGLTVL